MTRDVARGGIVATNLNGASLVTGIDLDVVLAALNEHRQRATYSAVAALLGQSPRVLMHSRARERANSWIVSKTSGKPTGYEEADLHPELMANASVIQTREELASWLETHGVVASAID